MELAWESFCAGSLGIGAVVTRDGEVVATGRNRLGEDDSGDDLLAGTSLAHAELNALAKLRFGTASDGLELWTTLQPCLQCLGAIRLSPVRQVHILAPDPLFRGVERAQHLNAYIASQWPTVVELDVDRWSVLSLLLPTHVSAFWEMPMTGWDDALPSIAALARDLVATGELIEMATARMSVAEVADHLGDRLEPCVTDVGRLASQQ